MADNKFAPKTEEEKERVGGEVLNYVKGELHKNRFPSKKEIQKKFNISFYAYFGSIGEVYKLAGVKFNKKEYMKRFGHDKNEIEEMRREIIKYVKKLIENKEKILGKIICEKFRLDPHFYPYFKSLKEIVGLANGTESRNL